LTTIAITLEVKESKSIQTSVMEMVNALSAPLMTPLVFALIDHLSHSNSIVSLSNVPLTIASGVEMSMSKLANKRPWKEIVLQSYQIGAKFTTMTSSMEIIVNSQLL